MLTRAHADAKPSIIGFQPTLAVYLIVAQQTFPTLLVLQLMVANAPAKTQPFIIGLP
jgi:hypothetical protein